jgi:hypothetical protein
LVGQQTSQYTIPRVFIRTISLHKDEYSTPTGQHPSISAPICRQPRINSHTNPRINRHILTNIPKPRLRIFWLIHKIYAKTCATYSTEFMLPVLVAKVVHEELSFARTESKIAAERVEVQLAINLANAAVAFIDADSGKIRE